MKFNPGDTVELLSEPGSVWVVRYAWKDELEIQHVTRKRHKTVAEFLYGGMYPGALQALIPDKCIVTSEQIKSIFVDFGNGI